MVQPALAIIGTLLLGLALLALRRVLRLRRLIQRLATITTRPIAEADGFTRVHGTVHAPQPIPSAFQRRPSAYYAYRVEDPGDARKKERRLATGKDWADLEIHDTSGTIHVEARTALIRSPHASETTLEGLTTIPIEHAEFFESAGIGERHLKRFQRIRITEYTLEPGDEVFVTGTVRHGPDGKTFYRAPRSPLVVTPETDTGLAPGYRHELLLFSGATAILAGFATLFWFVALA